MGAWYPWSNASITWVVLMPDSRPLTTIWFPLAPVTLASVTVPPLPSSGPRRPGCRRSGPDRQRIGLPRVGARLPRPRRRPGGEIGRRRGRGRPGGSSDELQDQLGCLLRLGQHGDAGLLQDLVGGEVGHLLGHVHVDELAVGGREVLLADGQVG